MSRASSTVRPMKARARRDRCDASPLDPGRGVPRPHLLRPRVPRRVRGRGAARLLARLLRRTGGAARTGAGVGRHGDVLRLPSRLRRAGDPVGVVARHAGGRARSAPCGHRRPRSRASASCETTRFRMLPRRSPRSGSSVESAPTAGRPVYAANVALEWPDEHRLALWHAATLLREHRGDGHVATLVAADLDPCAAHALRIAADELPLDSIQPYRGWTDDDWSAAADRIARPGSARRARPRSLRPACTSERRSKRRPTAPPTTSWATSTTSKP